MKKYIFGFLAMTLLLPSTIHAATHPAGTNIKNAQGTVYRIETELDISALPYNSANAFLSYKFNSWNNVEEANSEDLNLISASSGVIPPRPGSLINDNGTIYQILLGSKVGFISEEVFTGLGYSFTNVYPADVSFMNADAPIDSIEQRHPLGTLVNDNGTLFINLITSKIGVPSMAVLDSWGYWVEDAVPANNFDRSFMMSAIARERKPSELTIFDTEFGQIVANGAL